jgi:hypothetical protein
MDEYVRIPVELLSQVLVVTDQYDPALSAMLNERCVDEWIPVANPPTHNGRCIVVVTWPSGRSTVTTCIFLVDHGFMGVMGDVVLWQPYPVIPGVTSAGLGGEA